MSEVIDTQLVSRSQPQFSLENITLTRDQPLDLVAETRLAMSAAFSGLVRDTLTAHEAGLVATIDKEHQVTHWDTWLAANVGSALRPRIWNIIVTQRQYDNPADCVGKKVCEIELWGAAGPDIGDERYHHYYLNGGDSYIYRRDVWHGNATPGYETCYDTDNNDLQMAALSARLDRLIDHDEAETHVTGQPAAKAFTSTGAPVGPEEVANLRPLMQTAYLI